MALSTAGLADAVAGVTGAVGYLSLHSTTPGTTGAAEISGGSPAYARKAASWTAGVAGSVTFDVPASTTVAYFGMWTTLTGGTFIGGGSLSASETFGGQGTYVLASTTVSAT